MSTVAEISEAIHRLPMSERWSLLHQFSDELWSDWDKQIEADLKNGRLDGFLAQARAEISAGRTRSLDEVLNDD